MIATQPAQAKLTLAQARALYTRVTNSIRDRHMPNQWEPHRGEAWDVATAQVVAGLMEWEAVAVFRYLATREGLAQPDVVLAKALAARLKVQITFTQKDLVE